LEELRARAETTAGIYGTTSMEMMESLGRMDRQAGMAGLASAETAMAEMHMVEAFSARAS